MWGRWVRSVFGSCQYKVLLTFWNISGVAVVNNTIDQLASLVYIHISLLLSDGFKFHFAQTFMVPRNCIPYQVCFVQYFGLWLIPREHMTWCAQSYLAEVACWKSKSGACAVSQFAYFCSCSCTASIIPAWCSHNELSVEAGIFSPSELLGSDWGTSHSGSWPGEHSTSHKSYTCVLYFTNLINVPANFC